MSEALERVIAEQQAKIDRLEAEMKSHYGYTKNEHLKKEMFGLEVAQFHAFVLREVITTPENREKWMARHHALRQAIRTFGYCVDCGCQDYCQCDGL